MEIIREYWAIAGALIAFGVWLVRLEAGMVKNTEAIERMQKQRREDMDAANNQRDKMEIRMTEISTDIKQILVLLNSKEDRK